MPNYIGVDRQLHFRVYNQDKILLSDAIRERNRLQTRRKDNGHS